MIKKLAAVGSSYKIQIPNPLRSDIDSIPKLISVVIDDIVIPVGAVIAVLMIMYAGWLYVTARGDKSQVTKARDALLYTCIGAAILLGAKLLASVVQVTVMKLGQ